MVIEYRVNWDGPIGGPGVTVFHGRTVTGGVDSIAAEELAGKAHEFFNALGALIPAGYVLEFPGEAVELNTTTGALEDVYTFDPPDDVVCSGGGDWAAPVGMRVEWRTDAIVAGRRLRGRTFIVPITAAAFDATGSPDSTSIGLVSTAAAEFYDEDPIGNVDPGVWSRTHGILADITGHVVPDQATVLRSRRD